MPPHIGRRTRRLEDERLITALRKRNPNAVVDRLAITTDRIVELLRAGPGD